ncbi:ABC transporter ATP-binding protein [Mediterraneibacter glycyrrhizinilyticus]|uniref:ABC transporter ATP-binding protein n=1 Tax=Mediterraneibacter glycyrrhizinilyticus TaxID=342942 RepID=UPI00196191BD|nr:ABC transporter ATP-binding protein [Mediterraneibacter glycyrrhizinilyticus]MBM6751448.1 ABC transporter ATP-binding protein [Mediterraneibacter glycyrrhizinilyticus]
MDTNTNTKEKTPVIEFKDFQFQYFSQAEPTLYNINLTINRGEKVLLVGPSGSGKSTLGHCLNGLIPFSYKGEIKGSLKIMGQETKKMDIFRLSKMVGTVLQDSDGQFIGLTVGEDVAFALENDCVELEKMRETVQKVTDIVDMGELLKSSPFELSGGQKQRVSFAGVMVDDVDILLFDEPLANLDPATGKTAIDLIDRVWRDEDKTVIIIEHRLEDVLYRDVDRVIVVSEGRIVADMSPDELMAADILPGLGIREPLYVTAMKYAGIKVTPQMHAGRLDTLDIERIREPLLAWNRAQEKKEKSPERPSILQADHISFQYTKKRKILQDISFTIREGEMVSVVGTNGAGKSTLAKVICGFVKEDQGKLYYGGEEMSDWTIKERSARIGYVMQNPNQMICKPMIYDEVALGLRIRGVPEEEIEPKVDKALKICGLAPFKKWPVSALSFGQKKRVTIASVLVLEPQILILDEPTAGQDYHHYTDIMEFLKSLNSQGVTIIMITHDMHLMLEYTPHAIVISGGKKIGDASAVEILTDEKIAEQANLKVTSLYELALKAGIEDPTSFVQNFIDHERGTRHNEIETV